MSEQDERSFSDKLRDSTEHLSPSSIPAPNEVAPLLGALVHALNGAGGDQLAEHLPAPADPDDADGADPAQGYSRAGEDYEARVEAEVQRRLADRAPASTDAAPPDQPASTEPGSQPTPASDPTPPADTPTGNIGEQGSGNAAA